MDAAAAAAARLTMVEGQGEALAVAEAEASSTTAEEEEEESYVPFAAEATALEEMAMEPSPCGAIAMSMRCKSMPRLSHVVSLEVVVRICRLARIHVSSRRPASR